MADKPKTIYAKLAEARRAFHEKDLKKSGENKFAGYKYFELTDFVKPGLECMTDAGLCPVVTFEAERALMRIYEAEGDGCIEIESPRAAANLKGCHPIQNLGAEETYQRRYLWMAALEIVEHDAVDASQGAAPPKKINQEAVQMIERKAVATGANFDKFMEWVSKQFGAPELAELNTDQVQQVMDMLENTAQRRKEQAA